MVIFWKIVGASSEVAVVDVDFVHFLIYVYLQEGRSTQYDPLGSMKHSKDMVICWMVKVVMHCEERYFCDWLMLRVWQVVTLDVVVCYFQWAVAWVCGQECQVLGVVLISVGRGSDGCLLCLEKLMLEEQT
jgi:hypothetical protein